MKEKTLKNISFSLSLILLLSLTQSIPLSTNSRWIVDAESGGRVKLKCVNWVGHMQTMLVEGLHRRPLQDIVGQINSLGFNCVRLTWATFMYTNSSNANLTATDSLDSQGLSDARKGFEKNNPSLLNLSVIQVQEKVVDELGRQGVMIVLDNHVSKPKWCCADNDGNGFFGDQFFDPQEWLQGLKHVANHYKAKPHVVAMSMRNELRGDRQNVKDWYKYIKEGANTIHQENPNLLVIVSGLSYDTDLTFLKNQSLGTNLDNKLVYEAHRYSWSGGKRDMWTTKPINQVCQATLASFIDKAGFLLDEKYEVPLFMSEFGVDQRGTNIGDNRFLACFMSFLADNDLDWALWSFPGSYYMRGDSIGPEDTYGVVDADWSQPRNPKFTERFGFIQKIHQEPSSSNLGYKILFHPESGRCVRTLNKFHLTVGQCESWDKWSYEGDGNPITLMGTSSCIKALGDGRPVRISKDCSNPKSIWKLVSSSKLHIAVEQEGKYLCLEAEAQSSRLITKECICVGDESDCLSNPQTQWFKFIFSNIN